MRALLLYFFISIFSYSYAQPSGFVMTGMDYIERYKEDAIREMLISGIPASITLAQGMVESGNGNSPLATYANNHFGIKCHKDWNGFSFTLDDDEKNECFRKYASVTESYSDHSKFIKARRWYAPLFELKTTDYKGWAYGLKKAGYATHPKYAEMLIEIIEQNNLNELDKLSGIGTIAMTKKNEEIIILPKTIKQRTMIVNNGLKCIVSVEGDTYEKIATDISISKKKLFKYNEVKACTTTLKDGDLVYLENKGTISQTDCHIASEGESIYQVSQQYGIQLKNLCLLNRTPANTIFRKNERVLLK